MIKDMAVPAFLILFPHFVPLPFYSYAFVCFLVIYLVFEEGGKNIPRYRADQGKSYFKALFLGIISALISYQNCANCPK
ncbi:hypothetical protein D7322_28110 [Sphingobacterium puteale]|uniref:Uncharacterized protein n=1 Tax=Sphingobacterium puteale TaxID=2420510 RepID=A0A420VPN1_9SPHI|nr:hypothetical protein D7322_28110 [Sphingobacterium puteale]